MFNLSNPSRSILTCWVLFCLGIFSYQQALAKENQLVFDAENKQHLHRVIYKWVQFLNNTSETELSEAIIFTEDAKLNLVETTGGNRFEKIKQRAKEFRQGEHIIKSIDITQNEENSTHYNLNVVIDWADNLNKESARFQQTINIIHLEKSGQFLIENLDEQYLFPDDSVGTKLKC